MRIITLMLMILLVCSFSVGVNFANDDGDIGVPKSIIVVNPMSDDHNRI